jgi:hypothetical protein
MGLVRIFDSLSFSVTGALIALKLANVGDVSWLLIATPLLLSIPVSFIGAAFHLALQKVREEEMRK